VNEEKSALIMLQQYTGCSIDNINTLSNKITSILEDVLLMPHEDKTNKIEMLRKIENELSYFTEKRNYISERPKDKDILKTIETRYDNDRKLKRNEAAQIKQAAIRLDKEEKNNAKKLRQENLIVFKGHPQMERARKKDLKPKVKNDTKIDPETMAQIRYIG
jgi:hypothetical protein